jgi:hypothetical protein
MFRYNRILFFKKFLKKKNVQNKFKLKKAKNKKSIYYWLSSFSKNYLKSSNKRIFRKLINHSMRRHVKRFGKYKLRSLFNKNNSFRKISSTKLLG